MVMGHELTHGFDDQGRKFNGKGMMEEWWDASVATEFDERAQCVVKQYDQFKVTDGSPVNGKLTLGENIADLGGIKQAYLAYMDWQKQNNESSETTGTYTLYFSEV